MNNSSLNGHRILTGTTSANEIIIRYKEKKMFEKKIKKLVLIAHYHVKMSYEDRPCRPFWPKGIRRVKILNNLFCCVQFSVPVILFAAYHFSQNFFCSSSMLPQSAWHALFLLLQLQPLVSSALSYHTLSMCISFITQSVPYLFCCLVLFEINCLKSWVRTSWNRDEYAFTGLKNWTVLFP